MEEPESNLSETLAVFYAGGRHLILMEGTVAAGEVRVRRHAIRKDPEGFAHGLVTHLEKAASTLESLWRSLFTEEKKAELPIYAGLGNPRLKTFSFSSSQYYQGLQRTISSYEIRSVVNQTRSVATLPLSEFVLQAVPDSFLVNDLEHVRSPLGLEAYRLGVHLKFFTMNFQDFRNLSRAFEAADLEVAGYFPKTLALSESVLTEPEREKGAVLIDISDSATEIVLWKEGSLVASRILSAGGGELTSRVASKWGIDLHDAEKVKEQYGSLEMDLKYGDELIPLVERNGRGNHTIARRTLQSEFLQESKIWFEKIFAAVDAFSEENHIRHPHLVFAGGTTRLDGFLEFLQKQFAREARLGIVPRVNAPHELVVNPSLAPMLGTFHWLAEEAREKHRLLAPTGLLHRTLAGARDWFSAYF